MKIGSIRVLNNYKVKLINAKLSGVNTTEGVVEEQGTRTPVIPTPPVPPTGPRTFQERFDIVMKYLIERYEPGWSAADPAVGRAATMALLGVSGSVNPLVLGGAVESAFKFVAYPGSADPSGGWFDPLTHPKDFASAVRAAYKRMERARSPQQAKHKFINYDYRGIAVVDYTYAQGGNANTFFRLAPNFRFYPDDTTALPLTINYDLQYRNGIERMLMHSPYGKYRTPMSKDTVNPVGSQRVLPWMTDRYTGEGFKFDAYLQLRESTTLRDLLNDPSVIRDESLGVIVDGVTDTYLNRQYSGLCFLEGTVGVSYMSGRGDPARIGGGYSADIVPIGSPWISYPNGITYADWWNSAPGLCFDRVTLVMFDGSTFSLTPPVVDQHPIAGIPVGSQQGLSYGYGEALLNSLNELSAAWGNSMEFISYLGFLPYGDTFEITVPFIMYKDPSVAENVRYFKWRMDAAVSHWKQKFKSPIDGFAHVFIDASALIERTHHRWTGAGLTAWRSLCQDGTSFIENIPVSWSRDQYNYTYGPSGPNANKGVVLGTETFAQYMFVHDRYYDGIDLNDTSQSRYLGDPLPRHWCLDDDKATALYTRLYDIVLGQRKRGFTYSNSIWGMGICGSSTLGEVFFVDRPTSGGAPLDGFPFFYNTFIEYDSGSSSLKWKRIANTQYNDNLGVPWHQDRRFRLFYLYPIILALNGTIVDHFHDGLAYYRPSYSGWFDVRLGNIFKDNMETGSSPIVSNVPRAGRRTPTTPPQNYWNGNARESEFELLYACMKGGITAGLDSLHFTKLYNELDAANVEETPVGGYYRSLDFNIYASTYYPILDEPSNPAVVPLLKSQGTNIYYRGNPPAGVCGSALAVNNTGGLPYDQYLEFKTVLQKLPLSRRAYVPIYWLLDGPPNQRRADYFWKQTSDGTTYGTDISGKAYLSPDFGGTYQYGDTDPLRFGTIWSYENRANAKESFTNFLKQAREENLIFTTVNDDSEAGAPYGLASYYTDTIAGGSAAVDSFAINSSYLEIPDARRMKAHVLDPRFRGVTSSVTGRSFAEEFEYIYNNIRNSFSLGNCGESAETILNSYYTDINDRFDYRTPYGGDRDRQYQWYAFNSALYTFWHGDLKTKIIGGALDETTGFSNTRKYSSDVFATNAAEARFATDLNGHHRVQEHIPGYGHQVHCYGQLSGGYRANGAGGVGGLINSFGYPSGATTNEEVRYGKLYGWQPVSEGGLTFSSSAYQAMIADLRRIRGILRTRPQAYQDGIRVWVCGGITGSIDGWSGDAPITQFYEGNTFAREYYLEEIYHLCLNGIESFNVFNYNRSVSLLNEALVEWKVRSGNTHAIPCSNATGSTGATVDRIDLYEAGTNMVISGGYVGVPDKRLWRMTAPPGKISFVRTDEDQVLLPRSIPIPAGSRGVWLEVPASYGIPKYQTE